MIIAIFAVAIILLILLITKVKLHPFLSLLLVSLFLGIAAGIPVGDVASAITAGFGGTMQSIGIVVVAGVIIGEILELTGGAQKIADAVLKLIGIKRATYAASATGAIISIPVFCDSGYVILNPVIKGISRSGKLPMSSLVVALMAGLLTTHAMVPPTPGPVAAAGIVGASIGKVMLYGIIVTIPVIIVCSIWANSKFIAGAYPAIAEQDKVDTAEEEAFKQVVEKAPSTFKSFLPIVVPILLIVLSSFFGDAAGSTAEALIAFVGTPWVALIIGVGICFTLPTKLNGTVMSNWVSKSMLGAAEILLITSAAGSFSKVLQSTDIGSVLTGFIMSTSLPPLLIPFVMAFLLCAATGSTTVAMSTSAGLMAPLIATLGISPELTVLAIAAGGIGCCHSNSSYFWCVAKLAGMDMKQGYRCITMTSVIMGVTGCICVLLLSLIV